MNEVLELQKIDQDVEVAIIWTTVTVTVFLSTVSNHC